MYTDGIIFDVDGTLWDSTDPIAAAWNTSLVEIGHPLRLTGDILKQEFGKPLEDIILHLLPDMEENKRLALLQKWYVLEDEALINDPPAPYAGLEEVLRKLQPHCPLFIVSNCQAGYIERFLDATGLHNYFTDHTCPGDTGLLKADNIYGIARKHGLKHAVYVGDIQADSDAVRKASGCLSAEDPSADIRFIHAAYGFGTVKEPDLKIQDIRELPDVLL
ncbi:MAG: HAD family hydrolase [Eubacteriales bacterium]|nr:HAD family hydrolase [Eubacteriales bacterium]